MNESDSPRFPQLATDLEAKLQRNPQDLEARENLIDYYYEQLVESGLPWGGPFHEAWTRHVYWTIENRPESKLAGRPQALVQPPCGSEEDYEKGKQLWLAQTKFHSDNPAVLRNAGYYLRRNDRAFAQSLLEAAYALKPEDADLAKLLSELYSRMNRSPDLSETKKREMAQKALAMGEQSLNASAVDRFYRLGAVAKTALEAMEVDKAGTYAQQLLNVAPNYESNWNYGNAIHNANVILGRIALRVGDLQKAGEHLIFAGKTPGSPQLNSFGPDMILAKELLEHGQRDVVLQYFNLCMNFWEMGRDQLRSWIENVEQGRVPEFDR